MKSLLTPLPIFGFIIAITLLDVFVLPRNAAADPKPGLFWENGTSGVAKVQKLVDTRNGVVCYVAVNDNSYNAGPAISCVKP